MYDRSSNCSAGSLSTGNGPCSLQFLRRSVRSTALHTAASPKVAAHVLSICTLSSWSSRSEQPAPSSSGTTRLAISGASEVCAWWTGEPHLRAIDARRRTSLAPAVAECVVPALLGAGCSLLELELSFVQLSGTWASTFGDAAVCSAVLRRLSLEGCRLRGPLPELRLLALQLLNLHNNELTGNLEPLAGHWHAGELRVCRPTESAASSRWPDLAVDMKKENMTSTDINNSAHRQRLAAKENYCGL